jgi:hypothetical protein
LDKTTEIHTNDGDCKGLKTHTALLLRLWLSYCSIERHYSSAHTLTTAAAEANAPPSAAPRNHVLYQPCTKPKFNSYFTGASCHCLNGQSPPSNRERPGSVPWDVRRAKWKRRMAFSQHFGFFPLATIIPVEATAGSAESAPPQRYNSKYFTGSVPMVS